MIENARSGGSLIVLHAQFAEGQLSLWAESAEALINPTEPAPGNHPCALDADSLTARLNNLIPSAADALDQGHANIRLSLPAGDTAIAPSRTLSTALGRSAERAGPITRLAETQAQALIVKPEHAGRLLDALTDAAQEDDLGNHPGIILGPGTHFLTVAARLADHVLSRQRFVPMLRQDGTGTISGSWEPWLADEATAGRVAALVRAMPPIARAAIDHLEHDPWRITAGFVSRITDARCRLALIDEEMFDTVAERDTQSDEQVAWMHGLLDRARDVPTPPQTRSDLSRTVRRWIGGLEEKGRSSDWRLLIRVNEPLSDGLADNIDQPGDDLLWSLSFHLQSQENDELVVDGADIWLIKKDTMTIEGLRLDEPQELLLGELGRASRIYKKLESVLDESEPIELTLETKAAYEFLREVRPLLEEQGFGIETPPWWDSPAGRLGARLKIESESLEDMMDAGSDGSGNVGARVGLSALVGYHWEIAIGDTTLTLHEFEQLASKESPLVRINGKWVEIRPEDVKNAVAFIQENPGGEMKLAEAMRLAYASDPKQIGVPIVGMEATGWVASILDSAAGQSSGATTEGSDEGEQIPLIETPASFQGTLRPYQQRGLSWLAFLENFGFGGCLADDMGLGKTVQLLALLAHERSKAGAIYNKQGEQLKVLPTLLIVPMSVVGNWLHESKRFTPDLRVLLHHGVERAQGDDFLDAAINHDLIVTTYALANRDSEMLGEVQWGRIVLDEAQFIKNPAAKQSVAVRALRAERRIALTGTPVENRLSELWSIMDFLNPGYLGPSGNFRKKFSVPIERYRDVQKSAQLRGLVRPFILRRVKTDPTVVADLPEKLESREYTHLTSEQASLYETTVKRMLSEVEASEGIHRRGLVLAALIKLKQICNHPAQALKDHDFSAGAAPDPARSGKATRLLEMIEEVLAEGERALVFTQFRQMGHLLASMLRQETGREVLFLHGGTAQGARVKMVEQFQDPNADKPILILSLKAGGVGLNLTAATHVFHYDRWWNPAVENQATDRAYRIGQTRTVHVHKFVVRGTLEERIDEMIESKTELAERIIGAGERWLTELDTDQLRNLLALRADAIGDEE